MGGRGQAEKVGGGRMSIQKFVIGAVMLGCTLAPAFGEKVIYKIKVNSDNNTINDVKVVLYGDNNRNSGWITLKGEKKGQDEQEYVIEYIGTIRRIGVDVMNQAVFGDDWQPTSMEVESPWPKGGNGAAKSTFVMGDVLKQGGKSKTYKANKVTNLPPITVSKTGKVQHNDKVIKLAHFQDNPTSGQVLAMQSKETWTRSNSVGLSTTVTNESSNAISLSYESPETVAGTFGAGASRAWSEAVSKTQQTAQEEIYSKEQTWSYTIEPRTAKFRLLVLRVPTDYTLYVSDQGEKRWIRQPGGPVTDTGAGQQIEIPQTDRQGNIIPINWSRIENDFLPYMDAENRKNVAAIQDGWFQQGWVYRGNRPVVNQPVNPPVNQPVKQPVNQPQQPKVPSNQTISAATLFGLAGTYRYEPYSNDWHQGDLTVVGANALRWTNKAGASWTLTPDAQGHILMKSAGSPYMDTPDGDRFEIQRNGNGEVTGFRFLGEIYHRR